MHNAVLATVQSAGPLKLDELFNDLQHQRWIGQQHDPPIEVDVPRTKLELIGELDRLGHEGLLRCGPSGWEPLYVPTPRQPRPVERMLF